MQQYVNAANTAFFGNKLCIGNCWRINSIMTGVYVLWRRYWKDVVLCFRSVTETFQKAVAINAHMYLLFTIIIISVYLSSWHTQLKLQWITI